MADAPADAVILFEDIDLVAMRGADGPRVWLASPKVQVHDAAVLRRDEHGVPLQVDGAPGQPNAPDRVFHFRRQGNRVEFVN